jgi:hypothetical protein
MKSKQWLSSMIVFAIACRMFPFSSVTLGQETVTVRAVVTASTRLSEGMLPLTFTTASRNSPLPFEVRTAEPDIRSRAPENIWTEHRDE